MKAYERLLRYVVIPTASDEQSSTVPTTPEQFALANLLCGELKELGLLDACVDDKCYVYASLPATEGCGSAPALGWIAHMDTVSDYADHPVCPCVHENYDGGRLPLGDGTRVLDPAVFSHLPELKGRTLITSDGTTILGSDDKAGIAEIMTMLERIVQGKLPHGKLCIAFTPDEEVGAGADNFDLERFQAEYAYTVDGGREGEIEYENFHAASAQFEIHGVNVHPGSAKDIMVNAAGVACEIQSLLPREETPEHTEGYQGFYHLTHMSGEVGRATLSYLVRDHDRERFQQRKKLLECLAEQMNEKYGADTVTVLIQDQYYNMREKIQPCMHMIETAKKAAGIVGIEPKIQPIRGGTDGARLSYMGLPCPNLGTGGFVFHGPYEHVTAEGMELVTDMLLEVTRQYTIV